MINIDIEGYFKDRYWNGWWFDRACLYEHLHELDCERCQLGVWTYTSVEKTGMNRFGDMIEADHVWRKSPIKARNE